jgi:signal transduction histidine kinase
LVPTIISLSKLLDLDLAIIEYAYQMEYLTRVRLNEQLAKVGHIAASVGHALREPLNVVKTSIYYLRHATEPAPAKRTEHLQRVERNVEKAQQILEELSDLAAMPSPQLHPFPVGDCVDEALDQAGLTNTIRVTKHIPATLPQASADVGQIRNVFVRLIRRSREGMDEGGQLSIRGQDTPDAVEVVFEDTGVLASKEALAALESPLSWSSVRVLGMNLAIVRAVLEVNAGSLRAKHESGRGSTITVSLCPVRLRSYT